MEIAIIGSGVSGMVVAHLLHREHSVTVFEADARVGGHVNTVRVWREDGEHAVDTGFIVFNDWTYPNFIRLIDSLGVASRPAPMSFGVSCERTGLEYASRSLTSFFADPTNLARPSFYRMAFDILRFNRAAPALLAANGSAPTLALGAYLESQGYSREMIEHYVVPMGSAIWSADPARILEFPAQHFVRFFHNHGMLNVFDQPQWRVIRGGSRVYMEALTRPFLDRIRTRSPVEWVRRHRDGVTVKARSGRAQRFDHVVIATHADQALAMLADPSDAEREVLGAIPYQPNPTTLHTDTRLLPRRRAAWACWNYHLPRERADRATLTYDMNRLQSLAARDTFCVTLNGDERIASEQVLERILYHHPIFTPAGIAAQRRHAEVSGTGRTHFCGAYWGYGFHEDGVKSALAVAARFGKSL